MATYPCSGITVACAMKGYDELGEAGCAQLQAVSMDLGEAYRHATDTKAAGARQCVDPFHVIKLANQAIDAGRRWAWNQARAQSHIELPRKPGRPRRDAPPRPLHAAARWVKHTRWALLKDFDQLSDSQLAVLAVGDRLREGRGDAEE